MSSSATFEIERADLYGRPDFFERFRVANGPIPLAKLKLAERDELLVFELAGRRRGNGFFPPGFRRTMRAVDPRLPEFAQGLGVIIDEQATFYPKARLRTGPVEDPWAGQLLQIALDPTDGVPHAVSADGRRPLQLFLRWFGFSANYPGCRVFG